eukprot:scaffold136072_cov34-Prasinocladus_malaysianus.AAC.1
MLVEFQSEGVTFRHDGNALGIGRPAEKDAQRILRNARLHVMHAGKGAAASSDEWPDASRAPLKRDIH